RAFLDHWSAPDHGLSDLPRYLGPAIELESPFSSVVGEPYRGYAGIERWLRDIDEQFAEWSILASDVRDLGDQVLVVGTAITRGGIDGSSSRSARFPSLHGVRSRPSGHGRRPSAQGRP